MRRLLVVDGVWSAEVDWNDVIDDEAVKVWIAQRVVDGFAAQRAGELLCADARTVSVADRRVARGHGHSRSSQRRHHQPPCQVMGCPQMSHSSTVLGMRAPWCCDVIPTAWAWMGRHVVGCYPGATLGVGLSPGGGVLVLRVGGFDDRRGYLILGALVGPDATLAHD